MLNRVWLYETAGTPVVGGSPPTISSLSYTVGDPAGDGQSIVINGTNLGSVTAVTFGGTSATITAQTSTTVTVTLPAHAAGLVDVVVTNPDGSDTATNGFEYWDPTQISDLVVFVDAEKGVTAASNLVSDWADQSGNGNDLSESTDKFTYTATDFGSLHGLTTDGTKQLVGSRHVQNLGRSIFWVTKHLSNKTSRVDYAGNSPLTVIGDETGSINCTAGFSAGELCYMNFIASWNETKRGSGLNDGVARLYGWTHDLSGDLKGYVGAAQQGTTETGQVYDSTAEGYNAIGQGFGGGFGDGFVGDIAAALVINGIISGGDLTKLNGWSQQRWGTP